MTVQEKTNISTRQLVGLPGNPRKITQRDLNILCDSIRENGFYEHRPCAVEKQGDTFVVLDGNQRLKAARRLKMKTVPCVIYSDLTDTERNEIIMRGNINNGTWDVDLLQADQFAGVDYEAIGLHIELPTMEPQTETELEHDPDKEQASHADEQAPEEDPVDGHEMSATEAIAFKMVEKALSGDSRAATFCMQLQASDRLQKKHK